MKKYLLITTLFLTITVFSQKTKFSVEANYPLPIDNNFVGENYDGIIDLGVKYQIKKLETVNLGVSVNSSYYTFEEEAFFPAFDEYLKFKTSLYVIQPRFFCELNLKNVPKLHPYAGIGYSLFISKTKFSNSESNPNDESNNQSGLNLDLGLNYDITNRLYLTVSYNYFKLLQLDEAVPKTGYNTNVNILKMGVGFRI